MYKFNLVFKDFYTEEVTSCECMASNIDEALEIAEVVAGDDEIIMDIENLGLI